MIGKVLMTLGVMIILFLWVIYMPTREKEKYVTFVDKAIQSNLEEEKEAEE